MTKWRNIWWMKKDPRKAAASANTESYRICLVPGGLYHKNHCLLNITSSLFCSGTTLVVVVEKEQNRPNTVCSCKNFHLGPMFVWNPARKFNYESFIKLTAVKILSYCNVTMLPRGIGSSTSYGKTLFAWKIITKRKLFNLWKTLQNVICIIRRPTRYCPDQVFFEPLEPTIIYLLQLMFYMHSLYPKKTSETIKKIKYVSRGKILMLTTKSRKTLTKTLILFFKKKYLKHILHSLPCPISCI